MEGKWPPGFFGGIVRPVTFANIHRRHPSKDMATLPAPSTSESTQMLKPRPRPFLQQKIC